MTQGNRSGGNDFKNVTNLDPQSLIEMLEIVDSLKRLLNSHAELAEKEVEQRIPMLMMLFEYLVANIENPNIDKSLLVFLEGFLNISIDQVKNQEIEEEEHEEELEIDEKERQRRLRLAMYEIYKIINPNQLAGETALDNFINNVKTRGIGEAMKYSGSAYAGKFRTNDLENVETHGFAMREALRDAGCKGEGRGL